MAKTSSPLLLVVVLAGMAAGLWLAARTGEGSGASAALAPGHAHHAYDDDAEEPFELDAPDARS